MNAPNEIDPTEQLISKSLRILGGVSAVGLIWLMFLTFASVVLRALVTFSVNNLPEHYQFISYPQGIQDISELSLLVVVFFGIAYTGWTGGHIAVDLIDNFVSGKVLRWLDFFIHIVSLIIMVILTWQSIKQGISTFEDGEASHHVSIPFYPFYFIMAFGSFVFALVFAVKTWYALRGIELRTESL